MLNRLVVLCRTNWLLLRKRSRTGRSALDRYILRVILPDAARAPANAHLSDRRCTLILHIVGSPPCWPGAPCTLAPSTHRPASTNCRWTPRQCLEARFDRQRVPLGSMPDRWASASDRQLDLVHRSPPSRYSSSADRSLRTVSSSSPPLSYGGWLITNPSASRRSLLDDYQVLQ